MAYMKICPHICITRRAVSRVPLLFDDAKHGKNFRRGDVGDGPLAQFRKDMLFEAGEHCFGGDWRPFVLALFKPLAGDGLKCVGSSCRIASRLASFFASAGSFPAASSLACLRTPLAGVGQG